MICIVKSTWILIVILIKILKPVNLQFGVPIYGPPMFVQPAPIFPLPAPMLMMAPALASVATSSSSTSSEENKITTAKKKILLSYKPAVKKPPCPPCMCRPSCTPSFFAYCSPCHMKCRCKKAQYSNSNEDSSYAVPVPMPSIIGPQSLALVPVPPVIPVRPMQPRYRPRNKLIPTYSSEESTDSSSSSEYLRNRK